SKRHMLCLAFAFVAPLIGPNTEGRPSEPVHITVGAVQIESCDNDADLAVATIHVRVVFTNRGKRNLILSRKLGPDENVRVTDISGSLLYSPHPSYYESDTGELGDNPDDK